MFSAFIGIILANMLFLALHLESRTMPKPLTLKEEKEEFEKFHNGDRSARDRLIKHNLRLVAHIAKKYAAGTQDTEDFISIGTIGLIKAVQSFSYDKNTRFSTFRAKCIENEILMSFRKNKGLENIISLEDNLEINNDSSRLSLKDSIQDDFNTEEYCLMQEDLKLLNRLIEEKLPPREKQILIMRYGLGGCEPMTQQKVSQVLNISRSYVSRLETKAVNTLRESFGL